MHKVHNGNAMTIAMTLLAALILTLLPLPAWAIWLRPAWVLMALIYWAIVAPASVSVGVAWLMGLLLDLFNGTLLGEHALAFTVVIYFVMRMRIRLRMYPLLQQGLSVLFFIWVYQFIIYCIQGFIGQLPSSHWYWVSSLTSTLLWLGLFVFMRDYRYRWFKIA